MFCFCCFLFSLSPAGRGDLVLAVAVAVVGIVCRGRGCGRGSIGIILWSYFGNVVIVFRMAAPHSAAVIGYALQCYGP